MIKSISLKYIRHIIYARDRDCAASLDLMGGARFCEVRPGRFKGRHTGHHLEQLLDSVQKGVKSSEAKSGSAQQQLIYSIIGTSFCSNGYIVRRRSSGACFSAIAPD